MTRVLRVASAMALGLALQACTEGSPDREAVVVDALVTADLPLIRARPLLTPASTGAWPRVFTPSTGAASSSYVTDAADVRTQLSVSDFDVPGALPLTMGDAHPENYGTLLAADGTFSVEPNDFDGADRYPYLWELRRLCIGMVLGARLSNQDDADARAAAVAAEGEIARNAALGYAQTMIALATGPRPSATTTTGAAPSSRTSSDRSEGDLEDREELEELTDLSPEGSAPSTGQHGPRRPGERLPRRARRGDRRTARHHRALPSEPSSPRRRPRHFRLLDAARELASGIASWPRVRIILLVRGPTDDPADDIILELKELIDSGSPGWIEPGVSYDSVQERVLGSARQLWSRPDAEPLWGASEMLGFPVQIKSEAEALKTIRVSRFENALGTPEELSRLAGLLGGLMARMHASHGEALRTAIAERLRGEKTPLPPSKLRSPSATRPRSRQTRFNLQNAIRFLGPNLGVPIRPEDTPSPELQAVYGTPPVLPEIAP